MEHFQNPKNQGEIVNASGVGQVGNLVCGDVMKIYIKTKPAAAGKKSDDDTIADIKFETLGCGAAIACSSVLTEMAKGKKIKDALNISRKDIADALDGVPSPKMHCSVLAANGLKEAVKNYLNK